MKLKTFSIYCEVYSTNLFVVLGGSKSDLDALLMRKFKIDAVEGYEPARPTLDGCRLNFDKWPYHVLWLGGRSQNKTDLVPKLAHEVYHHVLRVLVDKGIPTYPEIDNLIMDEPGAYLMEFYMRELLKKI